MSDVLKFCYGKDLIVEVFVRLMEEILSGNVEDEVQDEHPKGYKRAENAKNKTARTVCVLISGKCVFRFPSEGIEKIAEKRGDYVFWEAGVVHGFEALENSVVLTIRWSSIPEDQESMR